MLPNYVHLSTATNVTVGGAGSHSYLVSVNVNTAVAGTLTIIDSVSLATIAVIDTGAKGSYWFGGVRVPGGIKITNSATADVTVSYI